MAALTWTLVGFMKTQVSSRLQHIPFVNSEVLVDQREGSGDWLSIRDRIGMLVLLQTVTFSLLILCDVDI